MTDDARTDAALLEATTCGDGVAFGVLVRRYIRSATLLATQLVGNRSDAEDIVQDAFAVVYRGARRFDSERPFAPWFFAIVRRLSANKKTRDARRARLSRLWGWAMRTESTSPSVEGALVARLDAGAATRALQGIAPMQRACFELVAIRGLSTHEVAVMHGISESTVRQHVFRARAALKAELDRKPSDDV